MQLTPNESLNWLRAAGWPMSQKSFESARARLRRTGLKRVATFAATLPEYHAEAIEAVRAIRGEFWRQYLSVKDPPHPDKMPEDSELSLSERAAWERSAIVLRLNALAKAAEIEPLLSAYMEAAELRVRNGETAASVGMAREIVQDQRPAALTSDQGLGGGGGGEGVADHSNRKEKEPHLVEDPDNPGTSTVVWHA